MKITIDTCESCDDSRPVTLAELRALENRIMSLISDKFAAITASAEGVKTRVAALEANAPTQADLDAADAIVAELDAIAPTPVEPPAPEPTP